MMYQGGKSRIAKPISEVINEISRRQKSYSQTDCASNRERERERETVLVSLFCGACSVESILAPKFDRVICNDNHYYLIQMLKGIQSGYELPDSITKEEYCYIKNHKDNDPILTGFVGFGCSFGGKWFGGYGQGFNSKGGRRNYCDEGKRGTVQTLSTMQHVEFTCKDYRDVELPENCIIYADPPYSNTTGYSGNKFDSNAFWEYAREVSKTHLMFISEQTAPDDFVSIWEKSITRTLDRNKQNQFKATEKLFIHKCNAHQVTPQDT